MYKSLITPGENLTINVLLCDRIFKKEDVLFNMREYHTQVCFLKALSHFGQLPRWLRW